MLTFIFFMRLHVENSKAFLKSLNLRPVNKEAQLILDGHQVVCVHVRM